MGSEDDGCSTTSSTQASRRSSASDSGLGCISECEPILNKVGHVEDVENANEDPTEFNEPWGGSQPIASLPLAGAVFGLCLGGPVGLMAGAKIGGVAAIGGSILGYAGASVIKEQKEM